jgi:hypothetical protein
MTAEASTFQDRMTSWRKIVLWPETKKAWISVPCSDLPPQQQQLTYKSIGDNVGEIVPFHFAFSKG